MGSGIPNRSYGFNPYPPQYPSAQAAHACGGNVCFCGSSKNSVHFAGGIGLDPRFLEAIGGKGRSVQRTQQATAGAFQEALGLTADAFALREKDFK